MRILISSGAWNGALCCVESLGRQGHDVDVLVAGQLAPAGWSRYCARRVTIPLREAKEAYLERLKPILAAGNYDLFIPISDTVIELVMRHRAEIDALVKTVLPANEAIQLAGDKALTTRTAREIGVYTPHTEFPQELDEFPAAMRRLGTRIVVKIPRSTAGAGVFITDDHERAMRFVLAHADPENWPIVQAFEDGDRCGVAAVCRNGEIVAAHGFRVHTKHALSGTAPYAEELDDPVVFEQAAAMARKLSWHGPLDFDWIATPDGRYALLELNPRFSGTISFGRAVGFDLPGALLDIADDRPVRAMPPRVAGRRYRSGLEFELLYLARDPAHRLGEVVRGWSDRDLYHASRLSDPGVMIAQVLSSGVNVARAVNHRVLVP